MMSAKSDRSATDPARPARGHPRDPLFEMAPVGCFLLDCEGSIRRVNRVGALQLRTGGADVTGSPLARFLLAPSREALCEHLASVQANGRAESCDVELAGEAGASRGWLRLRSDVVPDSRGWGEAVLCVSMEVDDLMTNVPEHIPEPESAASLGWDAAYGAFPGEGEPDRPPATHVPVRRAPPRPAGGRVLVVDDEELILNSTARVLRRMGYRSVSCRDPEDALRQFSADPDGFDAVVTDYRMPRMTGLQLSERLRELRPGLPVVLVSGSAAQIDRAALASAGVRRVLSKPLVIDDFLSSLDDAMDRHEGVCRA